MKEGFTFNKVSLMFLRKAIFKKFGRGGENRKEPKVKTIENQRISDLSKKRHGNENIPNADEKKSKND